MAPTDVHCGGSSLQLSQTWSWWLEVPLSVEGFCRATHRFAVREMRRISDIKSRNEDALNEIWCFQMSSINGLCVHRIQGHKIPE